MKKAWLLIPVMLACSSAPRSSSTSDAPREHPRQGLCSEAAAQLCKNLQSCPQSARPGRFGRPGTAYRSCKGTIMKQCCAGDSRRCGGTVKATTATLYACIQSLSAPMCSRRSRIGRVPPSCESVFPGWEEFFVPWR